MANHLFIGLGGTGGKVLREMRKRIYEEFHSHEPGNNVNIDYLYVDSSDDDLKCGGDSWKVMGKSMHLAPAQKVSIHGMNTVSILHNPNQYPGIRSFLSDKDVSLMNASKELEGIMGAGIGGQRRRFGRLLMANNMAIVGSDFASRLRQSVQRLQDKSKDNSVTFHICAGLAGGTGSGSIIDAIAQVRKCYPTQAVDNPFKMYLYLYLPEKTVVNAKHDNQGFYQANGYAALLEINALSVKRYFPTDVSGEIDPSTREVRRLLKECDAFEGAYLYTNVNGAGKTFSIGTELPSTVADFIFQKTVAAGIKGEAGQMSRLEKNENDGGAPEADLSGNSARSRKFLAFGIKRIEYPETEIEQYVTYNFARQAARQLQYNAWQEGIGYAELSDEEIGTGFTTEIKDRKNRERLMLSNAHLMLSKPIVDTTATKKWRDIDSTWEQRTQGFADDAQCNADKKSWLALFTDSCEQYYKENFRGLGVQKFYSTQRQEMAGYARAIRRHIECILFDEWQSGQKSLLEVEKYANLLVADCTERINAFQQNIAKQEEELDQVNAAIRNANNEWNNIGWLKDAITGASKKVFSAYKTAKTDFYTISTRIEAYRYAIDLLQRIIEQLGQMLDGVKAYKEMLNDILKDVSYQADSRCQRTSIDSSDTTFKMYNVDMVHDFTKRSIINQEMQAANTLSIRNHLAASLGEDGEHSFATLFDRTDRDATSNLILDDCEKSARAAMESTAKEDPVNKLVNVNILEKLKQDYNTDEKLEQFVKNCVAQAHVLLEFNQKEEGKQSTGMKMNMIQLCLPRFDEDKSGFRDKLIERFRQEFPGFNPSEDVSENYKETQIVIVAAASGFPLRYVSNVEVLKNKYELKLAHADAELSRVLLHTESCQEDFPSLFELDSAGVRNKIAPYVMLAYVMGIVRPSMNPVTQEKYDVVVFTDKYGEETEKRIGKDVTSSIKYLSDDPALADTIVKMVKATCAREVRSNDKKIELHRAIVQQLKNDILPSPECEGDQQCRAYQEYKEFAQRLYDNELKEL